jgi:hypothetical protein
MPVCPHVHHMYAANKCWVQMNDTTQGVSVAVVVIIKIIFSKIAKMNLLNHLDTRRSVLL